MLDPGTPASTKVRAAESVLNQAEKAIKLHDIEARLAEMSDLRRRLQKLEAAFTNGRGSAQFALTAIVKRALLFALRR